MGDFRDDFFMGWVGASGRALRDSETPCTSLKVIFFGLFGGKRLKLLSKG